MIRDGFAQSTEPILALIDRTRSERPPDNSRCRREPTRQSASRCAARTESEQASDSAEFFSVNGASFLFMTSSPQSLAKRLEVKDLPQNGTKHAIRAVRIASILIAAAE